MKRTSLIIALVLLAGACLPGPFAQEPPVTITGGALLRHGDQATAAFQFGGNINIVRAGTDSAGQVRGQVFVRPVAFFGDDYTFDDSTRAELQAVQAITMVKLFRGQWAFGIGAGSQQTVRSGGDEFRTVLCAEGGWRPLKYCQFTLGAMYIPIGGNKPDYVYPYFSIGLDVADILN